MFDTQAAAMAMIAGQLRPNRVNDARVLEAIKAVPRDRFVPAAYKGVAYVDEDLPVAPGRFLLSPMVFARLVCEAEIGAGTSVLDIGCATGYSAAVLGQLAESVVALEEEADLAKAAERKLMDLGLTNVAVLEGPLVQGAPAEAPFDVIFLNGLVEEIPSAVMNQLGEKGRLVCVARVDGVARGRSYHRVGGAITAQSLFDAGAEPLPGFQKAPAFEF